MTDSEPIIYRGYTQAELDAQYQQRTLVPDVGSYLDYWDQQSHRARETLACVLDVAYGPSADERLDIYPAPVPGAPVHVHLHGGAWRLMHKAQVGFMARHFVPAGACFVTVGFSLATRVPLEEMVRQVRVALAWIVRHITSHGGDPERIFLSGHSSGAHLAGMLLADGWRAEAGLPETLIRGALLLSGLYDLEPVRLSSRNAYLHLDDRAVWRNSPILHLPRGGPPVLVGWGDGELDEFKRQSGEFASAWSNAGLTAETREFPDCNHFDIYSAFTDPAHPLLREALSQMGLT